MHPDLAKLIVLQTHDLEAKRLRDELAAVPKRLAQLETQTRAAAGQRDHILDLIAQEEAQRRRLESDIEDLRQKLARAKKKVDMATTTHQVTALEHEIAFVRVEIGRLEDIELEGMERSEGLEEQRSAANAAVGEADKTLARESARAAETLTREMAFLAEVDRQRQALRGEIVGGSATGEDRLAAYDRIAHAKGSAISEALNQKCTACQMMLRPQRWNDIRDNSAQSPASQEVLSCENCGRLLFYDPARDSPQRKTVQSESIAASIVRAL